MKKIILTCTALFLTFVLFGCSSGPQYTPRDTPAKEPYKPPLSNVSAVTETDAPNETDDVVSEVEVEKTYWEKLCFDFYGIEGLTEPKKVKLFQDYSSESSVHIEYITDNSTVIAKQLAQQAFDTLKSKNISIYTCVNSAKGEPVEKFEDIISMEGNKNSLYEMIYTYNNQDLYFSTMAYVKSDPTNKNKYMRLSCYRYFPPTEEASESE